MGIAPKNPSPTRTEKGKGGTTKPPVQLTEMLAREGAPWRPFEGKGILVKPLKTPRMATEIFAACEKQLLSHLRAVCMWPETDRNQSWRVGDYSFYVMFFNPAPRTQLYLQFWSEPDEGGAIFEVSSGAWNPPADKYVDTEKQELLRDHGFEIGGNANNFRKIVTIENAKDLRAVAREAVAIACKVMGYDGTLELGYKLNLQTQMTVRHVLSDVSPYTLEKMLHEWGFPAELKVEEGKPPLIESRSDHGPFGVLFSDATKEGSKQYHALRIRTFRKVKDRTAVHKLANQLNQRLIEVKATIDEDGDLMIESQLLLHGGVTAEHVRARFELWRRMIGEIAELRARVRESP
jgi:hypothetical protein